MAGQDRSSQGLDRFGQTAIAFDELIVQVGRAIARAQESMDMAYIDFQRQAARAITDGSLRAIDVIPASTYSMPETKLDLRIGLSMRYPEGGGAPELSAVPLNATTANQSDIDVEASTAISLRFVAVPQGQELPGPPLSALAAPAVVALIQDHPVLGPIAAALATATLVTDYAAEERLWLAAYLEAREPVLLVVVDDRSKSVVGAVAKALPPSEAELALVGAPVLARVEPPTGRQGQILTLYGDDLLTLAGQTVLEVDGLPVPVVRHTLRAMAFKVPSWVTRGDLEVITPLGRTGSAGAGMLLPLPSFSDFTPRQGYFDSLRQRGTALTITGSNLRAGCTIRFATGVTSRVVEIATASRMQVEVPEHAGSGPLTLVFTDPVTGRVHEETLATPFVIMPRIHRVSPRQAKLGDEVTLAGDALADIAEVQVGPAVVPAAELTLHTPTQIRFRVPSGAGDGPIRVRMPVGEGQSLETASRDIFYVVPRITGFAQRVAFPDQLLTVHGEGLDPNPDMMTLLFDGRLGISEAPVLGVAADRRSLITRAPSDVVTGYALLLRKQIYSSTSPDDTSNTAQNKLTVLAPEASSADVILEDRFDAGAVDLARWTVEAGQWRVGNGLLRSEGSARLGTVLPEPRTSLAIYADVLAAEMFGISLLAPGSTVHRQMWINLARVPAALTWSTLDSQGRQNVVESVPLAILAGTDHFVSMVIAPGAQAGTLAITVAIDQEPVHTHVWAATGVVRVGLLGNSATQRWDNVVMLKGDYLRVPVPELYRFGSVLEPPQPPPLSVTSFVPQQGAPGTRVVINGVGLDEATRVFFGGVPAPVVAAASGWITVEVPQGAVSGPIEVHGRGGAIITTRPDLFLLPPKVISVVPARVLAGGQVTLIGANLPASPAGMVIEILGQPAEIVAASGTMVTVRVPEVSGTGSVVLRYSGFEVQAPVPLEVRREELVIDLLAAAAAASWTTAAGSVVFGRSSEGSEPSVRERASERLEDDIPYGPVLVVRPPSPSLRALRGVYPVVDMPDGNLELRLELGLVWVSGSGAGATGASGEATVMDGILFEIGFVPASGGAEIVLLPRTACVRDGSLESYVIDAAAIRGQRGQLVLSVFPGRSGLREDAAIVSGVLVQVS